MPLLCMEYLGPRKAEDKAYVDYIFFLLGTDKYT